MAWPVEPAGEFELKGSGGPWRLTMWSEQVRLHASNFLCKELGLY